MWPVIYSPTLERRLITQAVVGLGLITQAVVVATTVIIATAQNDGESK